MALCNGDCLNCKFDDCIASQSDCLKFSKEEKNDYYTDLGFKDELTKDQLKYLKNREKYIAKAKKYYQEHKEERKKYSKKYYQLNKEKMIERAMQWQKENWFKEKERQREKTRRKYDEIKKSRVETV